MDSQTLKCTGEIMPSGTGNDSEKSDFEERGQLVMINYRFSQYHVVSPKFDCPQEYSALGLLLRYLANQLIVPIINKCITSMFS